MEKTQDRARNSFQQITVYSGKGGTGKTSFTAALAALATDCVFADCDVDAANLHLILKPVITGQHLFRGGKNAVVDGSKCTGCGVCVSSCRYGAITLAGAPVKAAIDPYSCEGCKVCVRICPEQAIRLEQQDSGFRYDADTAYGPFVFAELHPGEENSGKLITEVRKAAQDRAESEGKGLCIIDGPPGTGCAVMASLTGADLAIIVTEPTVSGIHDMDRAVQVAEHFTIPVAVVVNKSTINIEKTREIRKTCSGRNIPYLGEIPYSRKVVDAVSSLVPYVEYAEDEISDAIKEIWQGVQGLLQKIQSGGE